MSSRVLEVAHVTAEEARLIVALHMFNGEDGDRIAQMVIAAHCRATLQPAEALADTARGAGGFGHTGI